MKNKLTKNLIILGTIVFSLTLANNASARDICYGYYCNGDDDKVYYEDPRYDSYDNAYRNDSYYNNSKSDVVYSSSVPGTSSKTSVVNNYYYATSPSIPTVFGSTNDNTSTNTTKTSTSNKTSTDNYNISVDKNNSTETTDNNNTDREYSNSLGASAANGITALSLHGSGGFMPSSIWQWILAVVLILIIIILIRVVTNSRPRVSAHHDSTAHAH